MSNILTITKAAELAGITRQTMSKKVNDGVISKTADGKIELSELLRVFPTIKIDDEDDKKALKNNVDLQHKIELLEQSIKHRDETIKMLEKQIEELKNDKSRLYSLTEDTSQKLLEFTTFENKKLTWFDKLTGRNG